MDIEAKNEQMYEQKTHSPSNCQVEVADWTKNCRS